MASYLAEVTVVLEMSDGGQGGGLRPDDFAAVVAPLISVTAHPWVVNSSVRQSTSAAQTFLNHRHPGSHPQRVKWHVL